MEWPSSNIRISEEELFYSEGKIPSIWLNETYWETASIIFRVENTLRLVLYMVLKSHFGSSWEKNEVVPIPRKNGSPRQSISSLVAERMAVEEKYGYLGHGSNNPLQYLTTGEMVQLIVDENNWPKFKRFFPISPENFLMKMGELTHIRNAYAHCREIFPSALPKLKQLVDDCLLTASKEIDRAFSFSETPTNQVDNDLLEISNSFGDSLNIKCLRTAGKGGYKLLALQWNVPSMPSQNFCYLNSARVNAVAVLKKFKSLKASTIFCSSSEKFCDSRVTEVEIYNSEAINVCNTISFIIPDHSYYSKETRPGLLEDLKGLISLINEESDLLINHPKFEGQIIQSCNLYLESYQTKGGPYIYRIAESGERVSQDCFEYIRKFPTSGGITYLNSSLFFIGFRHPVSFNYIVPMINPYKRAKPLGL